MWNCCWRGLPIAFLILHMIESIRRHLRSNRQWVRIRRLQREGFAAGFDRWRLWARILDSAPIPISPSHHEAPIEVHLLCSERDYLCAIWALKSFYHFSQAAYPLAIHLQGWCPNRIVMRLRAHFPGARIILQPEADRAVNGWLLAENFPRLHAMRKAQCLMQKLTDFVLLSTASRILLLDSDVFFFARPDKLLEVARSPSAAIFQRDHDNGYNITIDHALRRFSIRLAPAMNSGIAVLPRDMIDLSRCEEFLADAAVARPSGLVEQTLYALSVCERTVPGHLPQEDYLISMKPRPKLEGLVARHYTWKSRSFLTSEGIPALISAGFLADQ
jgi:hypothetical protein